MLTDEGILHRIQDACGRVERNYGFKVKIVILSRNLVHTLFDGKLHKYGIVSRDNNTTKIDGLELAILDSDRKDFIDVA